MKPIHTHPYRALVPSVAAIALLCGGTPALAGVEPPAPAAPQAIARHTIFDPAHITTIEQETALANHFARRPAIDLDPIIYADGFAKQDWWRIAKRDEPDRVMNHQFAMFGTWTQFPSDIDWNGMIDQDRETMWSANRFGFLVALMEADAKGGDPKYTRKGVELMLDWVRKCPAGRAKEWWAAWRPLEIGLRLNTWSRFLDYVARQHRIKPDELCILLASLQQQANYLMSVTHPGRGNQGFMENAGLGVAALCSPELAGSRDWLNAVWSNFTADVQTQIYPDGSHEEMSPIYQFTVLCSVTRVSFLATQRREPIPPIVLERLHAMNRYLTLIRKTDGSLPAYNDGDRFDLGRFFEFIARWQRQRDLLWILTEGREGDKPAFTSHYSPYSGLALFRGDWTPHSDWLILDAGPFGTGHQHHDALQIEYSAFGQDFLVEPGRYTYRGDDPIRRWLLSARAHNTITVDDGDQRSQQFRESWRPAGPIDAGFVPGPPIGFARGTYKYGYQTTGAENVIHHRSIWFLPGQGAVILDRLEGQGEHRIDLHWSCPPIDARVVGDAALIEAPDAGLLLQTAGPGPLTTTITLGQEAPPCGWFSEVYGVVHPAPHITTSARLQLPATLATVLAPFRRKDAIPVVSIALPADARTDRLSAAPAGDSAASLAARGASAAPSTQPAPSEMNIVLTLNGKAIRLSNRY